MTYKTIYTHISSLHSPFSLQHLLLRDVALSVFMLPLNVSLVSPHNLLLACAQMHTIFWVQSMHQKRTRLIITQMTELLPLNVTLDYTRHQTSFVDHCSVFLFVQREKEQVLPFL